VHESLYPLLLARAPLLRARPPSWGVYSVEGKFLGDLPSRIAACLAAIQVGNSDACLLFIRPLPLTPAYRGRPDTSQLARREITSQGQGSPDSYSMPSSHRILFISQRILLNHPEDRRGPRAIHLRHRAAAATRAAQLGQQSSVMDIRSTQLQALEAPCAAAGHQDWTAGA
jgi:hypothetical protein